MKIVFNKIIIRNFLSIGEAEIDFRNLGYVLVLGKNLNVDDNALSNGSGKSSIFESISWVLTGETVRGIKSSVSNMNCDGGAYVEIDFLMDDKNVRIIRTKDNKEYGTTLKLYVNGEDKSGKGIRDTSKILSDYLPDITSSLLGSVVILGQNLQQRFSNNTPSGRKEVLENLTKSDFMIADIKNRVSNRKQSLSKNINDLSVSLAELNGKKEFWEQQKQEAEDRLSKLNNRNSIESSLKSLRKSLNDKELILSSVESTLSSSEEELRLLREDYIKYHENSVLLDKELIEAKEKVSNDIDRKYSSKINLIEENGKSISVEMQTCCNEIDRINKIVDVCPTCGQKIVGVSKPDTKELTKKYNELKQKFLQNQEELLSAIEKRDCEYSECATRTENEFKSKKLEAETVIKKISEIGTNYKKSIEELSNSKKSISSEIQTTLKTISMLEAELENFDNQKEHLEKSIKSMEKDISDFDEKIMYIISSRNGLNDRLDIVNKMSTIVSRDFRGFLLKSLIEYIDDTAKEYARCVFDTDKISFSLDGNNIDISYCGKSYENLSSGERQKVDIIIQFSIRDMLCRCFGFSCNILVLDEIFDGLDFMGCQKVIDLVSTRLSDIESVFIVTHRADLSIPYDKIILVEKNSQGISRVNDIF